MDSVVGEVTLRLGTHLRRGLVSSPGTGSGVSIGDSLLCSLTREGSPASAL